MGLHSVFGSSRDCGCSLPYDRRPWVWRVEAEAAYRLDPPALYVFCPPHDASACLSPSSQLPTSLFELATSPVLLLASFLVQPSQLSVSVCFPPAFRDQKPRLQHSQGVVFPEQRPCGPIRSASQQLDHACHELLVISRS